MTKVYSADSFVRGLEVFKVNSSIDRTRTLVPLTHALDTHIKRNGVYESTRKTPGLYPSALMPPTGPGTKDEHAVAHTGLFFIDLDFKTMPHDEAVLATDLAIATARKWRHTILLQRSVSGLGLHILCRALPVPAGDYIVEEHIRLVQDVWDIWHADTGLQTSPDRNNRNLARVMAMSNYPYELGDEGLPLVPKLAMLESGERHDKMRDYALHLYSNGYELTTILDVLDCANQRLGTPFSDVDLDAMLKDIEANAAKRGAAPPGALINSDVNQKVVQRSDKGFTCHTFEDVAAVLVQSGNFQRRYNLFAEREEFRFKNDDGSYTPWSYGWPERARLEPALRRAMPKMIWLPTAKNRHGRSIAWNDLKSAYTLIGYEVNPIAEMLEPYWELDPATDEELSEWTSVIFQCDPVDSPHYVDLLDKMYADAALRMLLCCDKVRTASPAFSITLYGSQGSGKTAVAEELLPEEFKPFTGSFTASRWGDVVEQVGRHFLLEAGEFNERRGFETLSLADFRNICTKGVLDSIPKYIRENVKVKNNAVLVSTANPGGNVLQDGLGNRREHVVVFPDYPTVAAAKAAGVRTGDCLRANRRKLLARGLRHAQGLLEASTSNFISVSLNPDYEALWYQGQAQVAGDTVDAVLRAMVTITANLPGWQTLVPEAHTYECCDVGGVHGPSLRALSEYYSGERTSSNRINKALGVNPKFRLGRGRSPLFSNKGFQFTDGASFLETVEQLELVDEVADALAVQPVWARKPVFKEFIEKHQVVIPDLATVEPSGKVKLLLEQLSPEDQEILRTLL